LTFSTLSQGDLLTQIVDTVTANQTTWVELMLREELGIQPITRREAIKSAFFVLVAAIVGAIIPVIPFIFLPASTAMWISLGVCAVALFGVGLYKSLTLHVGNPFVKGLEMMVIGIGAALIGWAIGLAFNKLWPS
jgi:predicted membrane protein (TIGR00267 family)